MRSKLINIVTRIRVIATAVAMIAAAIVAMESDPVLGGGLAAAALSSIK